jgi:hypothetical protein
MISTTNAQVKIASIPKHLQDMAVPVPVPGAVQNGESTYILAPPLSKGQPKVVSETTIGTTWYDLQSNASMQNRIYRYPDSTIVATWMFGIQAASSYPDRGTGYNSYAGGLWGSMPTARIESVKVGWPSYAPWGAQGEIIVTHNGATGLNIAKRAVKTMGTWTQTTYPGPTVNPNLLWPRMVTSGSLHDTIHVMCLTAPVANAGVLYNGMDGALLYSRSTDGGTTWGINNIQIPGMDTSSYRGFAGDCYAWAEPKGNKLSFVVGDDWLDLVLLKSNDNGTTWTKTVIWQHPYPKFNTTVASTIYTDTFYCPDGNFAAVIDNNGLTHVFFGIQRALASIGSLPSWFPFTDGLAYWNETMGPITSPNFKTTLHPDSLRAKGKLVGWAQDMNNNGTINFLGSYSLFYCSVSSQPCATVDNNNNLYVVYSSMMENLNSLSTQQNYRHIWARKSIDGGGSWGSFLDITGGINHNYDDCVFPSLASSTDDNLHVICQVDGEPGLSVRGDLDAAGNNNIVYLKVPKTDLQHIVPKPNWNFNAAGNQHYINLPAASAMVFNGNPLTEGDYIGVFYDSSGTLKCGGYSKYIPGLDSIIAHGNSTGQDNGFTVGEKFRWKVWRLSDNIEYAAAAIYNFSAPNDSTFALNGISTVTNLYTGFISITMSPGPTVCPGTSVMMMNFISGGYPPYTYSWTPTATINNPHIASPLANPMVTTTYTLVVTDIYGLQGTGSATVNIIPPPSVSFAPLSNVCDNWPQVPLSGGTPAGGSYSGTGVTGGMFSPATAGLGPHAISYTYTDPVTGCHNTATSTITVVFCVGGEKKGTEPGLTAYPNPVDNALYLYTGKLRGELSYTLIRSDGQLVLTDRLITGGHERFMISLTGIGKGIYFLKIESAEGTDYFKVIKSGL